MPRINPYTSSPENLSESTRGSAAWEQVGRRIGPLYNEAAQFQKEQGQAIAQGIKQMTWPWSIAKLLSASANAPVGGLNIRGGRLREDSSAVSGSHIGLPDNSDNSDGVGQISRGAGALGRVLRDGGRALAAARPEEDYTLYKGELVSSSTAAKYAAAYNQDLAAQGATYQDAVINTQNYWRKYNSNSQTWVDPTLGSSRGPDFAPYSTKPPAPDAPDTTSSNGGWLSGVTSFVGSGLQGDYEVSN